MSSLSPTSPLPPPSAPAYPPRQPMHTVPMLLPVFIIFFLFVCFLCIFLFRDLFHYLSDGTNHRQASNARKEPAGLDPAILSSFPTLPFSAVRGLQEGKCGCECAVCLLEFNEADLFRLLTVCCHAFHSTCIDSWLASHSTCPICRSDLKAPPDETTVLAVQKVVGGGGAGSDSHVIVVEDDPKDSRDHHHLSQADRERRRKSEEEVVERNVARTAEPP